MRSKRYTRKNYNSLAQSTGRSRTDSIYKFEIRVLSTLCLVFLIAIVNLNINNIQIRTSTAIDIHLHPEEDENENMILHDKRHELVNNDLIYFNVVQENRRLKSNFPSDYPMDGPVIAILVASRQKDVDEVCTALKSLAFLEGDDKSHPAPVLIFNEGDLSQNQTDTIIDCTERPIAFPLVDFTEFPQGFDHTVSSRMFRVGGRKEWGYYQMIRFWVTGIWEHPALEPYEVIMRIDTDSCFKEPNDFLPNFKHEQISYHSQYVGVEDGKNYTIGLLDFATNWLEENGRTVGDPMMWDFVKSSWKKHASLPVFRTNFELSSKKFMQQKHVKAWHEALTEHEPYGIFKYRWGDAVERFLTMAMFTKNENIMTRFIAGYNHKQGCTKEEVEEALSMYFTEEEVEEQDLDEE